MNKFKENSFIETVIKRKKGEKVISPRLSGSPFSICFGMVFFLIIMSGCKQNINENKIDLTDEKPLPHPSWVKDYPIVFSGNWDDMAIFQRRKGGSPVGQEDDYNKQHSDEAVKKLKEMGITLNIIHFYKGFGIEAEKDQMEDAKKLASLCKKYGIKVGVYVGFDIAYETFLLEKPEAQEWFVPDYMGHPVLYGKQTFRKRVYFMHPGYIEYIKRVLRIAIEDLKVDLIHFDNTSNMAHPPVFFHPLAIENFRTYLNNKYSPEMLKMRFGFSDMRYVEPPKFNVTSSSGWLSLEPISPIDDPLFQEWTDFRCQQVADFYSIMERYIRGLNPEVAIAINPHTGLSGRNTMWEQSVDYPKVLSHTDYNFTEEGIYVETSLTEEGILNSKIRTYKMDRTLKNRIITYTWGSKLLMAESLAYNQGLGEVGYGLSTDKLTADQQDYIKFFHKNLDCYNDIVSVADVAIVHSYATMAFNYDLPYQSTFLYEQALIQEKIPFDIIFDENLKDLSRYKVLVLADQECLSDEKLDLIRNFVNQGGGLVATENTSLYTEWRQKKRDFGLNDLFHVKAPEGRRNKILADDPATKTQVGKGRVVYIPGVKPSIPKPSAVAMTCKYWKLPVNCKELIESVKWASGDSLSLGIEAPQTVTMELTQKKDKSALILHLVNFNTGNPSVKNIKVDMKVPDGKRVSQITIMTPDGRADEILQFQESGKHSIFNVPELSVYDLVVMKLQ